MYNPNTKQINVEVEGMTVCEDRNHYHNMIVTGKCDACKKTWVNHHDDL